MSSTLRFTLVAMLLAITAACFYLSVAAREAPRESWWAYWSIYATVGAVSVLGAVWLLRPAPRQP